jgi:hypothetical protein
VTKSETCKKAKWIRYRKNSTLVSLNEIFDSWAEIEVFSGHFLTENATNIRGPETMWVVHELKSIVEDSTILTEQDGDPNPNVVSADMAVVLTFSMKLRSIDTTDRLSIYSRVGVRTTVGNNK